MAAPIVTLAESLKDFLNTLTLSQAYTAKSRRRVRDDMSEVQGLNVWVVPIEETQESATRSSDYVTYVLQIVAIRGLNDTDVAEDTQIDAMLALTDEIKAAVMRENFTPFKYVRMENVPIYDPIRVDKEHLFMSIIRVSYVAERTQET